MLNLTQDQYDIIVDVLDALINKVELFDVNERCILCFASEHEEDCLLYEAQDVYNELAE